MIIEKIDEVISEMTLKEKASLLVGYQSFNTLPIERLNIPTLSLSDGPNGLRKEELSRLFDKIVVFDKNEITKEEKDLYNLNDMMYNELYENGGLAFHLKFMYPQTITNRRM